jgi:uncharacterized protein (DUF3084 family)
MENQKKDSNSNLKVIVVLLLLLLLGSLGYIFKMSTDAEVVRKELKTTLTEKESVMKDLQTLKSTYDAAIAENSSMSDELIKERDKVISLMDDIKKSKGDIASMAKYKTQFSALQGKMKVLMAENDNLKKQNVTLIVQRDSTKAVLDQSQKSNEALTSQNSEMSKTLEKASKLAILNTKTAAYKVRSSGRQIETDKANRTDVLKISFTIAENKVAKAGNKSYYIQVIDANSNVLGEKRTEKFGAQSLTYSFITTVNYNNETVDVSQDLAEKDFAKGTYMINVFDKDQLVSKTSFTLK